MSKAYIHFLSAALVALALSACAGHDAEPDAGIRKDAPAFTATIGGASSRAFDHSWEPGDEIGISGCDRFNVCYLTVNADRRFSAKTAGDQIYFQNDSEISFKAYHPWNALAEGTTDIKADTRDQLRRKSFDFLWACASGKKDAPVVAFNFGHKMAKVSITVKPGREMTFDEIKTCVFSFDGLSLTGSFNTADGSTTVDDPVGAWVFSHLAQSNDSERTLTFSFILFPQLFAAPLSFVAELNPSAPDALSIQASLDFTDANKAIDGDDAENEWVAGRQYNLSLTLHKTEISLDKCVIAPWNPVIGDDIIVD